LSEEITLQAIRVFVANVVNLMLPRERDFEFNKADPLWLLSVLLGFGDDLGVGRRIHVFASLMGLWPVRPERQVAKSTAAFNALRCHALACFAQRQLAKLSMRTTLRIAKIPL
jgi:hypothetical protein